MDQRIKFGWTSAHGVRLAHVSCLCLGITLLAWGVATAALARLGTGEPTSLTALALRGGVLLLGGAFIGFHILIRRGVRWALWSAYLASVVLCGMGIAVALSHAPGVSSSALLILSGCTMLSTWLALVVWPRRSPAAVGHEAAPKSG